jgi:hypothetical protein
MAGPSGRVSQRCRHSLLLFGVENTLFGFNVRKVVLCFPVYPLPIINIKWLLEGNLISVKLLYLENTYLDFSVSFVNF